MYQQAGYENATKESQKVGGEHVGWHPCLKLNMEKLKLFHTP